MNLIKEDGKREEEEGGGGGGEWSKTDFLVKFVFSFFASQVNSALSLVMAFLKLE